MIIIFNSKMDDLQKQIDILKTELYETKSEVLYLKMQLENVFEKKNEIYYQKRLEKLLNGTHKRTKHGVTDIFTTDAIYEIKCWKNYKSCFGQLQSYYLGNEDKRLCAVFYDEIKNDKKNDIVELFTKHNIQVYEIKENNDGIISLNQLNDLNNQCIDNDFYNWLDKHIEYKEGNVLKLSDTIELYTGKKISSRQLGKYRKELENYIKEKYKNIDFKYNQFMINNIKYKGWKDLYMK